VPDVKRLKSLERENARPKRLLAESLLENEVMREALRKNGNRTGPSGLDAVDADEGIVATPSARGGAHECFGVALSTTTGSQHRAAHVDRSARAASRSLWRWNDLLVAASTWRVREPQAS
jgi:hypothetical protein